MPKRSCLSWSANRKGKTRKPPHRPGISFENGSIETMKNMVRSVMGYSLIPELSVDDLRDHQLVRRFKEPQLTREISLVVHHSFTKKVLLDHLRKAVVENVPDSFQKNSRFIRVKWR